MYAVALVLESGPDLLLTAHLVETQQQEDEATVLESARSQLPPEQRALPVRGHALSGCRIQRVS